MVPPGLSTCTMTARALDDAGEAVELAHPFLVVADQAGDRHARDVGPGHKTAAVAQHRRHDADGEHDQHNGDDAPEGQLAPHAAAVNDQVRIKRHWSNFLC